MPDVMKQVRGVKVDSYNETEIYEGFPVFFYDVVQPKLSEEDSKFAVILKDSISGKISYDEAKQKLGKSVPQKFFEGLQNQVIRPLTMNESFSKIPSPENFDVVKASMASLIKESAPSVKNPEAIAHQVLDDVSGYGKIAPLMRDTELEEIMINGYEKHVFVFHKTFGMCKTNIFFTESSFPLQLINRIASTIGKKFGPLDPLLDARLIGGSRANATFSSVTPFGPSITIRKFTKIPLSVIDLISNNTLTDEVAAFLWVMVEGMNIEPMNIIVTGGTGSGKTTTLNVLSTFIRHQDRIVTIEDTLELDLGGRENWVQLESKPKSRENDSISMDDLLRNSLRMRPDRIIVGEVRGSEAQTLFVAMDTGHEGCMGTLHSNSSKEMVLRLNSEPMAVPESMIGLLDLIVVQYRMYIKGKGILRRIAQVSEVSQMGHQPLLSTIYEWDRKDDIVKRTDVPSRIIETLAEKTLRTKKEVMREINVRRRILQWMKKNNIRSNEDVETIIQRYYYDPESILEKVATELADL